MVMASSSPAELLGVLGVQSLPAGELDRVRTHHAPDGSSTKKVIQDIETDVPPGCAHRHVAAIDIRPQRQARAAPKAFELPPHVEATPVVFEQLGSLARVTFVSETCG